MLRKKWIFFLILLYPATTVFANPTGIDLGTLAGIVIFLFPILALESFVVTDVLFLSRMAVVPSLFAIFIGNLVMYFIVFTPFLYESSNVPAAEFLIIIIEGIYIKAISRFSVFQMDNFNGLKWRTAFIASAVGNALSYYIGTLMSGRWF
jgi:hypothetical protein